MIRRKYQLQMKATEQRMRELGLLDPLATLALDQWEIERDSVIINRKLGEGAFGMVYGGELFDDSVQCVRTTEYLLLSYYTL